MQGQNQIKNAQFNLLLYHSLENISNLCHTISTSRPSESSMRPLKAFLT